MKIKKVNYKTKLSNYGNVMTIKNFLEGCENGCLIDYDGFGNPVKNNLRDDNIRIYPSERNKIPKDATHIIWYNR